MSGGYTPLFASLTTGTLCGRWPDIGLWPIVLALADRHGVVDVTIAYLSAVAGLPQDDVAACMSRFCQPDPYSRSIDLGGARLILVDPEHRSWGWRVVNHAKYREKARKAAYDSGRTESGRDAERKRLERESTRDVPTSPDASRVLPLSDSDKTKQDKEDSRPLARTDVNAFHQEVIQAYHELCPDPPRVKTWTKKRRTWLDGRIRERCAQGKPADTIAYWRSVFDLVAASDFLCGRTGTFRATLEWLTNESNFAKVIECNYSNRGGNGAAHAQ